MVALSAGSVVLIPFPFSDLSQSKLRPAIVLADVGRGDWVLCQVTSNRYGDATAIPLSDRSFANGSLNRESFVRPGKLFTASQELITKIIAVLSRDSLTIIVDAIVALLKKDWRE